MSRYRVSYDEEYLLSGLEQYRKQRQVYPWFIAVKIVCALGLATLLAVIAYGAFTVTGSEGPLLLIGLVLVVFLLLLLQGPRLDCMLLKRRLRKSPFYGDEVNIFASVDGVCFETPRSKSLLNWSAFSRVRRVASGFLLFTDPKVCHWLPDSGLVSGTSPEVESLLRKNIVAFEQ